MFRKTIYFCPQCYSQNEASSVFCGKCGLKLPTSQMEYIDSITRESQYLVRTKYQVASEVSKLKSDLLRLRGEKNQFDQEKAQYQQEIDSLKPIFDELLQKLDRLQAEEMIHDFGFYKSRYDFESSNVYRLRLDRIRQQQKELIREKNAARCDVKMTLEGSLSQGRKMTNDTLKLMLFAFNGESDVLISKVKYNNVNDAEKRIQKTFDLINKMGAIHQCYLTQDYLNLKLEELFLAHEYQEKLYEEKEEQRRIREQIREEEIARREIEKALNDAEREETRYEEALKKAREEVEKAVGEKQLKFLAQIEALQNKIAETQINKERAMSRAQMTRSGHVYVISNIGSFGEDIYKIGMTRRLDPMDRVIELGDASVPFRFDVHAIIYSDDAPTLENQLHKKFNHLRLNQVNNRKEFFKVSLHEIASAVLEFHGEIEFTLLAEAVEYRKTVAFLEEIKRTDQPYVDILEI